MVHLFNRWIIKCQKAVADILSGRILVGHALQNDLTAMLLSHPRNKIRDTSRYRPYMKLGRNGKYKPRSLKDLTLEHLGLTIQQGEHDSVEDARCAMKLYKLQMWDWEVSLKKALHGDSEKSVKATPTTAPAALTTELSLVRGTDQVDQEARQLTTVKSTEILFGDKARKRKFNEHDEGQHEQSRKKKR